MKKVVLVVIVAMLVMGLTGTAIAKPSHPTFGTFVNVGSLPTGSVLVLNITHKVINDEDNGLAGYWALITYNKTVQVWQVPDDTFYVVVRYLGRWETFIGAVSPGSDPLTPPLYYQSKDASGTFQGGYQGTFIGAFNPGELKTQGFIGTKDYGGSKSDVLLGIYSGTPWNFATAYFPGYSNFAFTWGWTYHYRGQTWNNFDYGTTGDIKA